VHHNIALHIGKAESIALDDVDVCEARHTLYKGIPPQQHHKGEALTDSGLDAVKTKTPLWRYNQSISFGLCPLNVFLVCISYLLTDILPA